MRSSRKPVVLLVEDDALVRPCLAMMLHHPAFNVIVCGGGLEALAVARELDRPVDALVTDIVMPKMSGDELANNLRLDSPDLKTLFLTGYLPDAPYLQPLIERNERILYKPFEPQQLVRIVLDVLGLPNLDPSLVAA